MNSISLSTSKNFSKKLKTEGFNFYTGVPCSLMKDLIRILENDSDIRYIPAVREDVAVAIAVGAYLAGRKPMILMQNSGLGVCLNALTSLAILYKVPLLMLITWRGYMGNDAPEHILMGQVTLRLLDTIGVPYYILKRPDINGEVSNALIKLYETCSPVALISTEGVLT
jgi:sulfopyruvate decarboxylase subunit alpha